MPAVGGLGRFILLSCSSSNNLRIRAADAVKNGSKRHEQSQAFPQSERAGPGGRSVRSGRGGLGRATAAAVTAAARRQRRSAGAARGTAQAGGGGGRRAGRA